MRHRQRIIVHLPKKLSPTLSYQKYALGIQSRISDPWGQKGTGSATLARAMEGRECSQWRLKVEPWMVFFMPLVADLRHFDEEQDPNPNPHQTERSDPDPHQIERSGPAS